MNATLPSVPREELYLLNPPFIALHIRNFARGYISERGRGAPALLPFVAVPLVLYQPARSALPSTLRTSMYVWVEEHRDLQAAVADRAEGLSDIVRRGLLFGLASGALTIVNALLWADESSPQSRKAEKAVVTADMAESLARVTWIGRWFARAGDPPTVLLSWGLRP